MKSNPVSKPPNSFQYLPKPDIFSKGYSNNQNLNPHETTNMSIASLNSLNLDKINQKNENRIAQLGAYSELDMS